MATKRTAKRQTKSTPETAAAKARKGTARPRAKLQLNRKPAQAAQILAVSGVYAGIDQVRAAYDALIEAGFTDNLIRTSAMRPAEVLVAEQNVQRAATSVVAEYASSTARVAGAMLALGTLPLLATSLVAGPLLAALFGMPRARAQENRPKREIPVLLVVDCTGRKAANRAKQILESTGADQISVGEVRDVADLNIREYWDDEGQIHHHTRTYMSDHFAEMA